MIKGIGIDIVKISYIKKMLDHSGDSFLQRNYSQEEILQFTGRKRNADHFLAGRFAAKEAFLKAIGTGLNSSLELNQIEIRNKPSGEPFMACSSIMCRYIKPNHRIRISISHHEEYAVASVIIEEGAVHPHKLRRSRLC